MSADLEKLAYDSALRALDKQERLVEELRARTGAAVFVLLPKEGLAFSISGAEVSSASIELGDDSDVIYLRIADTLDRLWDENDETVRRLRLALSIASSALSVEVIALAALLSGTII